jgi:hypothetical protein
VLDDPQRLASRRPLAARADADQARYGLLGDPYRPRAYRALIEPTAGTPAPDGALGDGQQLGCLAAPQQPL